MQQDYLTKAFGLTVAFLAPGMIGLYAASLWMPALQTWFGTVSSQPPSVSGFLFLNVGAAGSGVFLSGLRWLLLERTKLLNTLCGERVIPDETVKDDISKRREALTETAYQNLVAQFYNFYLFYANTAIALVILYLAWVLRDVRPVGAVAAFGVGLLVALGVLIPSACNSFKRFKDRRASLLG